MEKKRLPVLQSMHTISHSFRTIFLGVAGLLFLTSFSSTLPKTTEAHNSLQDTIPPPTPKNLFYLYRTTNDNLIMYDLQLNPDGSLKDEEPVHIYWIRNTEGGKKVELSYIQRKFAYGLRHELVDAKNKSYKLNFVSYDKKDMFLIRSAKDKKYHIYIDLDKRRVLLHKIVVKIVPGGTFWVPKIPYLEVQGTDATTGEFVKERFKP